MEMKMEVENDVNVDEQTHCLTDLPLPFTTSTSTTTFAKRKR